MKEYVKPIIFIVDFESKDLITFSSPIVPDGIEDGGDATE